MGAFDHFPYTNFHELNLMWILEALKEIQTTTEQFVAINSLKYADPIQWNIVNQYEKNTIVIDPLTGVAYISVQAVPSGVSISNEDYWTVVFDLGSFVVRAAKNFTSRYEDETTLTATFNTQAGEWLVWGDTLYVANVNITAGDSYVVDGNITRITVEEIKNDILTLIGNLDDLNTTDKSNIVAAINEVLGSAASVIGSLDDLTTTDKSNIVAAINEVLNTLQTTSGDLDNLTTTDKSNLVAAINETQSDIAAASVNLKYALAGEYNHEALPTIFAQYLVDYESTSNFRPYNQGACSDDNYYYIMFIDDTESHSYAYVIDKITGVRTKYALSVATHANDCTIVGNYLISVYGNDLYVFNKNNMGLLYHQTTTSQLLGVTTYDTDKIIGVDANFHNIHIYDASNVANITLIETIDLQSDLVGAAPSGTTMAEDDILLVQMWDNTKASTIIFAYELNGNLITTITLPKNDIETESLIYENGKALIFYLRHWDQLRTTGTVKSIDLYNLITSQSNVDIQSSYSPNKYTVYADDSYSGFYVDGTSAKPFIDMFALTQFLEMVECNIKEIRASGSFGYVTFVKTGDNIELYDGTYLRVTAYCKSLALFNTTFKGDTYGDSGVYTRYTHLIIHSGDYYAPNTKPCINCAYGSLTIDGNITCHGGYYGIQAAFMPVFLNTTITNDNLVSTPLYINTVQMISANDIQYTRSGSNIVHYGSRNIELQGAFSQTVPANDSVDYSVTYPVPYPNTSRAWVQCSQANTECYAVVTSISATGFTVRIYNKSAASASIGVMWISKGA